MMKNLTPEQKDKLVDVCQKFVHDNKISCGETIYQCEWVIEHAYEFIEEIVDIIGYDLD